MKKKIFRITENDLNNIIKNIVKEICEIDDLRGNQMNRNVDISNPEYKKQQMDQDWENFERDRMYDKKYFDYLQDDNYLKDYNGNVYDFHDEKNKLPF